MVSGEAATRSIVHPPRAEARALVTHGLYSKLRHPIYLFSTIALIGIAICLRSLWFTIPLLIMIPIQIWRGRQEERVLREEFGATYLEYRQRAWL